MAIPSPSFKNFHDSIDNFVNDVDHVVHETKENGGASKADLDRLAQDIQKLNSSVNEVLKKNSNEDISIDAQIILGIMTQEIFPHLDRGMTILHAAQVYKKSDEELKEIVESLSQHEDETRRLLSTIKLISQDVTLRASESPARGPSGKV